MGLAIYLIFFSLLGRGKFSNGIKFSAESFAEISLNAERGKTHLDSLREKANVPQFGPCWKNAISDLQIGCKFLSEHVQSDLALRFTDCFLQMFGDEPLICDLPNSACLKNLSDRAFNAYTEFYTHTQSICYFLQNQIWHEETEKTIDRLSSVSVEISQKLEEAGDVQEKLLNQQKESLSLQHDLNKGSKNVAAALHLSQEKINALMKDFQSTAAEQKELILELFENLLLFRSWAVSELSWFSSTIYFATATVLSFLFTSVSRTKEARLILFIVFALNYLFERLVISSSSADIFLRNYFTITPESLNIWIWSCRKFCICLGIFILIYTAFSYYDYNILNYQLLLEIKTQNLEILNHFAKQSNNQNNMPKYNFNKKNETFSHICSTPKGWGDDLTFMNTKKENNYSRSSNFISERLYSDTVPFKNSNFFVSDVVDSEEKPTNKVCITLEKEDKSKKSRYSYNLRSHK